MSNNALQELALKYIRGEISKPEYRQQRKEIIDKATGYIEPETAPQPADPPHANKQSNPLIKASVISAIVLATLLVLYSSM